MAHASLDAPLLHSRLIPMWFCLLLYLLPGMPFASGQTSQAKQESGLRFEISFPSTVNSTPVDGRILLIISTSNREEPRFQVSESGVRSQQVFGVDVEGLQPGQSAVIDHSVLGYPTVNLSQVPAGDYYVQAVLDRYTTVHRAGGRLLKLPMDEGEGQEWDSKPGNLLSKPDRVHIDPSSRNVVHISLTRIIPPIAAAKDTEWVKHIRIVSPSLSKFWGRPVYLGAIVLLPSGWDSHPDAHYPLLVRQGHFSRDFEGFSTQAPSPDLTGFEKTRAEYAYRFYQDWTSGKLPHILILQIQHANPYGDDSYAVDSANVGPYGTAITKELIPYVESKFRAIGQGWARVNFGASTGGWEALASQVFYPEFYNGAWSFCPDPVDFRQFQLVNIYQDKYAFWTMGPWTRLPRGEMREANGTILTTMEDEQRRTATRVIRMLQLISAHSLRQSG